jgi:hypothetical protein
MELDYTIGSFLEMFKNGELEVEKYFGDYETFFSLLNKKGLMGEVDPSDSSDGSDWENAYLLWLYKNNPPKFYEWINYVLGDIVIEGEKIYWEGNKRDLARLFCDNRRNDLGRETVENILSGEDSYDFYSDTTDDVYNHVIEELTPKNLELLKSRMVRELSGRQLTPETNEMELIASEQGHDDYWELNSENVTRIIDDEESMMSLLDDELSDMKSDLYSIHNGAYNNAYESSVYNSIMYKLDDYFDTEKGEWVYRPHPYKKDVKIEEYRLPIYDFNGFIIDYLESNKGYGNSGTLGYQGGYLELLSEHKDCLSVYAPDYPDPRLVDKNINEYFSDHF